MQKQFDLSPYIIAIIKKWKVITVHFILACIVASGYSFIIAKTQYVSAITFLPPAEEKSLLSYIPDIPMGSISSTDIMPQQILTIFNSKALRKKIVEKYSFYNKYSLLNSKNKFEKALKRLKGDLAIDVEEAGSFGVAQHVSYKISSYHTSPDTCFEVIKYTFSLLDSTIREISIDKGRRNKEFVQKQLSANKDVLDSLLKEFNVFQKENKVYDISEQVQLSLKNYGFLKAQLIANEIEIKNYQQDFDNSYPLIIELKKKNYVLRNKIAQLEKQPTPNVLIGLEKSADIAPVYTCFLRDIEVQNKLNLLLTQQFEEAKLKEAKDISSLKIVDPAFIPEYKVRPKRIYLCVGIVAIYMTVLFSVVFLQLFYINYLKKSSLFHEITNLYKSK